MQCFNHQIVWNYATPLVPTDARRVMEKLGMHESGCLGRERLYARIRRHPLPYRDETLGAQMIEDLRKRLPLFIPDPIDKCET